MMSSSTADVANAADAAAHEDTAPLDPKPDKVLYHFTGL